MPRPGCFTPGKETLPIVRRLVGPQDRSERVRKSRPPPWRFAIPSEPSRIVLCKIYDGSGKNASNAEKQISVRINIALFQ